MSKNFDKRCNIDELPNTNFVFDNSFGQQFFQKTVNYLYVW